MSTQNAENHLELKESDCQVFALPIKLYLHEGLLFEVYSGGRTWRKAATRCATVGARLYRSGDYRFELKDGGHTRVDLEIKWERLGFQVDEATLNQASILTAEPPVLHQKRPRNSSQQGIQLSLWPLNRTARSERLTTLRS